MPRAIVRCERCGQDINIENFACEIHPEKYDYVIKTQLICRDMGKQLARLVKEFREKERRV